MKIIVSYRGAVLARGWEAGACLARAFRGLGHEVHDYGHVLGRPDCLLGDPRPPAGADLWVYVECGDADPQYGAIVASDARTRVYWDFDTAIHRGFTLDLIARVGFDHVFLGNGREAPLVRPLVPAVHFLPYAVAADRLRPRPEVAKTVDVGMVGQPTPKRRRLIAELRRAGISAALVQGKYGDALVEAINGFRIGLNVEVTGGDGLLNGRVWEVLGCGGFLLNERGNGIEDLFEDGRHLALFRTPGECVAKARHYLAHPEEAATIAAEGHRHALDRHTYTQRAEAMLACLKEPPASGPSASRLRRSFERARGRLLGLLSIRGRPHVRGMRP